MGTYFTESWFYEKFTSPDCRMYVNDREYMIGVEVAATKEDRMLGGVPVDRFELSLIVEMPQLTPCAFLANLDEAEDPLDDGDSAAAFAALKKLILERYGRGLVSYWYQQVDKERPGCRPLTESEQKKVRDFIACRSESGPLCKNAQDATYTIEHICGLIVAEMDQLEIADPLLSDHLVCFTELRSEILHNGLPTISDDNMFYEIVLNREAVSIQLCHVRVEYGLQKALGLFDSSAEDNDPVIIPYRTTLYSVPFPVLSCAAFAKRCGVDQVTVRQWIRRGKLRTAFKVGRDWMIPATTKPPARGFVPGSYQLTGTVPKEATAQYPFLEKLFSHDRLLVDKAGAGKFHIIKDQITDSIILATLTQEEREKFEYFLLEADWIKYDMDHRIILTQIRPMAES